MIYLDNSATTFPKPAEPLRRALEQYLQTGASPGRGGYDLAVEAEYEVEAVRRKVCRFFGGNEGWRVCFAYNATDALNTLIQGLTQEPCHVVSTRLEHNSVLRPLHHLAAQGRITLDLVPFNDQGYVEPEAVARALKPDTAFVMLNHASNVFGTVQPAAEIAALCREQGVELLLDASQSAGLHPIELEQWGVGGLAFTGHKSLLGPTGIGGLVLSPRVNPLPTRYGGTGVDSISLVHTMDYPHRLEAGTINLLGVLSLGHSLDYVTSPEHKQALARERELFALLRDGLAATQGVELYHASGPGERLPLLSCNVRGMKAGDLAAVLDGDYEIAVRAGLHCAPLLHQDLGTSPYGSVRFSLGAFNTEGDIQAALEAMTCIADVACRR
jgi:cysteine desulfurase/selenocysteine lyase